MTLASFVIISGSERRGFRPSRFARRKVSTPTPSLSGTQPTRGTRHGRLDAHRDIYSNGELFDWYQCYEDAGEGTPLKAELEALVLPGMNVLVIGAGNSGTPNHGITRLISGVRGELPAV